MTQPATPTPSSAIVRGIAANISGYLGLAAADNEQAAIKAAEVVYGYLYGALRGRLPLPVPADLLSVLEAASLRYAATMVQMLRTQPQDSETTPVLPSFNGWTFPEMLVIARYRQRTG